MAVSASNTAGLAIWAAAKAGTSASFLENTVQEFEAQCCCILPSKISSEGSLGRIANFPSRHQANRANPSDFVRFTIENEATSALLLGILDLMLELVNSDQALEDDEPPTPPPQLKDFFNRRSFGNPDSPLDGVANEEFYHVMMAPVKKQPKVRPQRKERKMVKIIVI
ncbi:hypothetical protein FN846DRAFT_894635 [Sphaerosporella brunnea]|uniref:Uncharacterized protein n=1 Tax=Sphaerosporella brunnea TaxID=1250544 RepID=A0A5J5EIS3_9PEZI|nr:hypothetical protein FN846DRAFT_894635 [Sphaerosporella brunnea]